MRRDRYWLWVVPLMLIMSALVVPRLGYDGLWLDEWYSVRNSGGALYGPLGVWGIVQRVVETDSTQALGYPLMLGAWGWFAGWTAFAGRVSSWLVGVLTVAMVYRLGHLVLGKRGGVYTALMLALGAFFVYFSHELRAYMLMAFFCCALVWAYIRLLQEHKAQTGWIQAIFVVSGAGLLWAHYYSAILLIGLGIYHVVFAEKNRRWWQVIGLAMLVGISFLPQVPGFLQGFQTYEPSDLGAVPLTSVEVLQSLIYYAGNGWGLFAIILLSMGMWYAFAQKQLALRVIIALSVLTIAVLVIANVALEILEPRRMRYAVFILPLCCVWIAGGMVALDSWLERLPIRNNLARIVLLIVPCLWLANGLRANVDTTFTDSLEAEPIPPFREIVTAIEGQVGASDLLALYNGDGGDAFYIRNTFELATYELSLPYLITSNVFADETRDWALEIVADTDRVWYVVNRTIPRNEIHTDFVALLDADFVLCRTVVDEDNIAVTLWV
ncbi:MAG: glycosyltransferase family 39 protein, partial [Chloroflexota bacterium]